MPPAARPFDTLLVANRGEIACRVMRTARRMGLRTVAVHSTVDARAPHVALADEAVELPGTAAADTYLDIEAVIAAALATGAQAVHPGYGFLSENPAFVDACEAAGLTFVGPPASAMRAMGLKDAAKALMHAAGVPVVPGYHGEAQDLETLAAAAEAAGYPVLIKARAGGGGKGMRRVDAPGDFADALAGARREAAASFGDDAVLIEKYVPGPRHVEVQVFGDAHGNVVHLYERDCSLQRRHQKVIEEAPAPGMTPEVREAMTSAAVTAAKAIGYVGAGTIEFIADGREGLRPDGFWFMEMNTRLQVEHPVTEAVTGVDLVEWQLRVAMGEPLPLAQADIPLEGHAVEARLYAEDASAGFLPATGALERLRFGRVDPDVDGRGVDGRRVDTGVRAGDVVSPWYDPMLAKLVAHGADRDAAFGGLARLLADTTVLGTVTNRDFLLALVRHPDVRAARLDTDLIGREMRALLTSPGDDSRVARAVVAVVRAGTTPDAVPGVGTDAADAARSRGPSATAPLAVRLGPWSAWGAPRRTVRFDAKDFEEAGDCAEAGEAMLVVVRDGPDAWSVTDARGTLGLRLDPYAPLGGAARVGVDGRWRTVELLLGATDAEVALGDRVHRFGWTAPGSGGVGAGAGDAVVAPMPGRVIEVACASGDEVAEGQSLLTLEAMKMEHALVAPRAGTVESLGAGVGAQVSQGDVLVRLAPED